MSRPLEGASVVVTRARHQSRELVDLLQASGAIAVEFPVIDIVSPRDGGVALDEALTNLERYDWLVVTSVNTVDRIGERVRDFAGGVAAIGTGTAEALEAVGIAVDLVPPHFVAESLVESFPVGAGRVLLPRASVARDVLPEGLRERGWTVDVVDAYTTVELVPDAGSVARVAQADAVTFTASSTVGAFLKTGAAIPSLVACIGPITAHTAEQNGIKVDVIADEHTIEGLVLALGREFDRREKSEKREKRRT